MSEEENDTSKDEGTSNKDKVVKKTPPNPFLSSLRNNQVAQAKEALMKTVCDNTSNTMGSIFEALENDSDGEYIMLEIFKSLTIEELVRAAAPKVIPGWGKLEIASVTRSIPDSNDEKDESDDDGDLDDDDEFDDDGDLDDDDDDEVEPAPTKSRKSTKRKTTKKKAKAKSSTPKKAPQKPKTKPKAKPKAKPSSGTEDIPYQKKILKCLSEHKARTPETAMSGPDIRDIVGGDDVEFRAAMGSIREKGRADTTGKARGTKYFRVSKKKS